MPHGTKRFGRRARTYLATAELGTAGTCQGADYPCPYESLDQVNTLQLFMAVFSSTMTRVLFFLLFMSPGYSFRGERFQPLMSATS
jgi:hypothetical protein